MFLLRFWRDKSVFYWGSTMAEQRHIVLTSHPPKSRARPPSVTWGAATSAERGPVIGSLYQPEQRNVIGVHSGAYGVYRALAIASGKLDPVHRPDLTNTSPATEIGPFPQWHDPDKIVSIDPWGHMVADAFADQLEAGFDIRPTIAITCARLSMPETREAMDAGRLTPDGSILHENGEASVVKAALEPVWYLPGMAKRLGITEADLRRDLFRVYRRYVP